jgi:hypothetical protein
MLFERFFLYARVVLIPVVTLVVVFCSYTSFALTLSRSASVEIVSPFSMTFENESEYNNVSSLRFKTPHGQTVRLLVRQDGQIISSEYLMNDDPQMNNALYIFMDDPLPLYDQNHIIDIMAIYE